VSALVYHFKTTADFIIYLEAKAKEQRAEQKKMHPRSHRHAQLGASAAELESIAVIVKTSNITVSAFK